MTTPDPLSRVIITGLREQKSSHGGDYYWVYFHDNDGKRWSTCIYKVMNNYDRWKPHLKVGVVLSGCRAKDARRKMIDADSPISFMHMNEKYMEDLAARKKRKQEIIGTQGSIVFPTDSKKPSV